MRQGKGLGWSLVMLGLVISAGCKRAGTYDPRPADQGDKDEAAEKKAKEPTDDRKKPPPLPAGYIWMEPTAKSKKQMAAQVPIKFVARGTKPAQVKAWNKLDRFWTLVQIPGTPLGRARQEVHIKVPLGLDDPTPHIPASNPPTVGKWTLGKRLFFDTGYLWPATGDKLACATCHKSDQGFSQVEAFPIKTPTLINCVYNKYLFWDGRATALEEVVQRVPEDEREPLRDDSANEDIHRFKMKAEHRHVWSGVVKRLRASKEYPALFQEVFGTPPTQDNIGKSIATYLRTILAGDSLYDRAQQDAKGELPQQKQYLKLLDTDTLKSLDREKSKKGEVARELLLGQRTFLGQGRCVLCHSGANFTDNGFHNIGVGESRDEPPPGKETGRFAALPVGLKDPRMIGAYKTPTLRCLPQMPRYFHDGRESSKEGLEGAVTFYARKDQLPNPHLDPILADPRKPAKKRDLKFDNEHIHALVVFLRALDGNVDGVVTDPETQPEGVRSSKR